MDRLRIDASYRTTNNPGNAAEQIDPFFRFRDGKGINNTSGFRAKSRSGGSTDIESCVFTLLVSTFSDPEWPDHIDRETGLFTYFGDNKSSGEDLHKTSVGGNRLLRTAFDRLHTGSRATIPPFLVFEKYGSDAGTYMRFLGLAAPGANGLSAYDDLVAVWRVRGTQRFQNYRARFTILKEAEVLRGWLEDLVDGVLPAESKLCPPTWARWVRTGLYVPLTSERSIGPRSKKQQLPQSEREQNVLNAVMTQLNDREFEFAAAALVELMDDRFTGMTITPRVRDNGRDAIGYYRVGHSDHQVRMEAIVEAKRWSGTVGVTPMARLISRLKHRDVGVFVTTGVFERQVQEELIADRHPVILVSGGDIARLLILRELDIPEKLDEWLAGLRHQAAEWRKPE